MKSVVNGVSEISPTTFRNKIMNPNLQKELVLVVT